MADPIALKALNEARRVEVVTTEKIDAPKQYITMLDSATGWLYAVGIENGNWVSKVRIKHIAVTTLPILAEYTHGDYLQVDGMVVTATYYDGTEVEITDYVYPTSFLRADEQPRVTYIEDGVTYEAVIPITISEFDPTVTLVDFEYVANSDGTYTLTGWKGTYNGEVSGKLIIPDNACIVV